MQLVRCPAWLCDDPPPDHRIWLSAVITSELMSDAHRVRRLTFTLRTFTAMPGTDNGRLHPYESSTLTAHVVIPSSKRDIPGANSPRSISKEPPSRSTSFGMGRLRVCRDWDIFGMRIISEPLGPTICAPRAQGPVPCKTVETLSNLYTIQDLREDQRPHRQCCPSNC